MKKSILFPCYLAQIAVEKSRWSRGVAQPGSAPGLGPGGRRFEPSRPDHHKKA